MGSSTSGIDETTSLLYDACVGFMVSEKTGRDSWAKVAVFVDGKVKAGVSVSDIRSEFKVVEQQLKADFKVATLPAAWRSAKTAALNAARAGVAMVDQEGGAHGKTAVEHATKIVRRGGTPPPRDCADIAAHHLATALGVLTGTTTITRAQLDTLNYRLAALAAHIGALPVA